MLKNMSNIKILFLGVVKNVADKLDISLKCLKDSIKLLHPDSKVVIYENDSNDTTVNILKSYESNQFSFISENWSADFKSNNFKVKTQSEGLPCRIECISIARNLLINHVKNQLSQFDIVCWIDLDGHTWSIKNLVKTANKYYKDSSWHAIFVQDISHKKNESFQYHDLYALRSENMTLAPEIDGEEFWKQIQNGIWLNLNQKYKVFSAFGGMGFYKPFIFKECQFACLPTLYVNEVYKKILRKDEIKFIANSGYDSPVLCEHVGLCFEMVYKGYDNMFIEPGFEFYRNANQDANQDVNQNSNKVSNKNKNEHIFIIIVVTILAFILLSVWVYNNSKKGYPSKQFSKTKTIF
jgi:hypothetical protein